MYIHVCVRVYIHVCVIMWYLIQLLDQNMSAAEKQTLSREASQGGGEGGSSSCSETVPSSEKVHCLSFGSIIQIAVGIISECAETEESFRQEMNAVISPVPSHLVNQSDFECVLCTRYVRFYCVLVRVEMCFFHSFSCM